MHILVVSQYFYPDHFQINDIVKELTGRGHRVTVLTGLPDYATSKVPKEYRWFRRRHEWVAGAEVYRVPIVARRSGAVWRSLNYLSFVLSGCWFAFWRRFAGVDVVYVWGTSPVTMAIPAMVAKRRQKVPLFFYCLDLWPESVKAFGFSEDSFFFRLIARMSRSIYKKCDTVAASSRSFLRYIRETDGYEGELFYLPQFGPMEYLEKDYLAVPNGVVDFLYAGNMGVFQDLDCIVAAAKLLKGKAAFKIHFVGDGSGRQDLQRLVQKEGLGDEIEFHGRVPFTEMEKYYRLADVCLVTLSGKLKIGHTLPAKMQGYLAAGKPVVGAIDGDARMVIEESGCGLCAAAGDAKGLAGCMEQFIKDPQRYAGCGQRGREYFIREFSREKQMAALETALERLTERWGRKG